MAWEVAERSEGSVVSHSVKRGLSQDAAVRLAAELNRTAIGRNVVYFVRPCHVGEFVTEAVEE